ncbi:hypothetical protein BCR39DRAFT_526392 [Naematelia encephala]|uniref:Gluconate 5-dehydrogenase n=1 Tax=Naematelia encephala TaxID=71784 RepID=A0A1Y2BA93_9TREE|nr:hypothetical protein BCR39DRAFT_526392 [Naematelia encephala]
MISIDYSGKIVLITGGGRGIGLGIAKAFAEAGATLIITYTSTNPAATAQAIEKQYGVKVHVYYCPAEKSDLVDEMVEEVAAEVGEIDVVIANAGVSLWRDAIDMTDAELLNIMQINLFAPMYLTRAVVRQWLKVPVSLHSSSSDRGLRDQKLHLGKKILFVSSISGIVAMTPQKQAAYNASKAGLTMLAKSLAGEWAGYGITVNAISPGYIQTDMIANPPPGEGEEWVKIWKSMTPVDRWGTAEDVANHIVLLCSDRAGSFMTGSDIVVDGGYTIF